VKSISNALRTHLAGNVTTLCACWELVRVDSTVFAFTSHDEDLTIGGVTYKSVVGFDSTAIVTGSTGQVDNLEVIGFLSDDGITEQDLKNGRFNFATIYLFAVNWVDLSMGILRLRRGWLGEVTRMPSGQFHAELRGMTQALTQEFGNIFSPICRADLGDTKCQVDLTLYTNTSSVTAVISHHAFVSAPLSYPAGVTGNTAQIQIRNNVSAGTSLEISDGINTATATWPFDTAGSTAFSDILTVIAGSALDVTVTTGTLTINITNNSGRQGSIVKTGDIANPQALLISEFAGGYLDGGVITWLTGNNTGVSVELKTYDPNSSTVMMWLAVYYPIQVGDTFSYYPGCDKRRDTCARKFNNIVNFRGEPDMPGVDKMVQVPEE
jgi:uncharacterized phage protein (TIGR02218 family)